MSDEEKLNSSFVDFLRQKDIFDPAIHQEIPVHIIGDGGIGSFTAVALAKLGLKNLTVWDGDKVEPHNVPNQLHLMRALGKYKVLSTKALCRELAGIEVKTEEKFWSPLDGVKLEGIVISALDSMEGETGRCGRIGLWKSIALNSRVRLYVDGRIGGETVRVLSIRPINDINLNSWYEKNLFPDKDAARLPCTGRTIIDVGFFIAAIITKVVRSFLKDGTVTHDVLGDMGTLTLITPKVEGAVNE
jgi:hypothetical protein